MYNLNTPTIENAYNIIIEQYKRVLIANPALVFNISLEITNSSGRNQPDPLLLMAMVVAVFNERK